jgi:hypothetical protein
MTRLAFYHYSVVKVLYFNRGQDFTTHFHRVKGIALVFLKSGQKSDVILFATYRLTSARSAVPGALSGSHYSVVSDLLFQRDLSSL